MTYQDNVQQAAVALKRGEDANWELARLTFESTYQLGDGRMRQPADRVSMEQWCSDIREASGRRFSAASGVKFKRVWSVSGPHRDEDQRSWSDAWDEASGSPGPQGEVDWRAQSETRRASPEAKREVFQQLARDPDVIEEAAALGSPTSRAVSDLHQRVDTVREERREHVIETDPIARRLDEQSAALDMERICTQFARDCERFAREITALSPRTGAAREEHLYWVRQSVERARTVLSQLETYVETGRTDLDAFLQDVLGGADRV